MQQEEHNEVNLIFFLVFIYTSICVYVCYICMCINIFKCICIYLLAPGFMVMLLKISSNMSEKLQMQPVSGSHGSLLNQFYQTQNNYQSCERKMKCILKFAFPIANQNHSLFQSLFKHTFSSSLCI